MANRPSIPYTSIQFDESRRTWKVKVWHDDEGRWVKRPLFPKRDERFARPTDAETHSKLWAIASRQPEKLAEFLEEKGTPRWKQVHDRAREVYEELARQLAEKREREAEKTAKRQRGRTLVEAAEEEKVRVFDNRRGKKRRETTMREVRRAVSEFVAYVQETNPEIELLAEIEEGHVEGYLDSISAKSEATQRNRLAYLKTWFTNEARRKFILASPAQHVFRRQRTEDERKAYARARALTDHELGRLLRACRDTFVVTVPATEIDEDGNVRRTEYEQDFTPPAYLFPAVVFMAATGARRGAVFRTERNGCEISRGLLWEDLDLERGTFHIPARTKTGVREIPIPGDALEVLLEWRAETDAVRGPVFRGQDGRAVMPPEKAFRNAAKRAGIDRPVGWHDLRRTAATDCKSEEQVAIQLGVTIATARGYKALKNEEISDELRKRSTLNRGDNGGTKLHRELDASS